MKESEPVLSQRQLAQFASLLIDQPSPDDPAAHQELDSTLVAAAATGTLTDPQRLELIQLLTRSPHLRDEIEFVLEHADDILGVSDVTPAHRAVVAAKFKNRWFWSAALLVAAASVLFIVTPLFWTRGPGRESRLLSAQRALDQQDFATALASLRPLLDARGAVGDTTVQDLFTQAAEGQAQASLASADMTPIVAIRNELQRRGIRSSKVTQAFGMAQLGSHTLLAVSSFPSINSLPMIGAKSLTADHNLVSAYETLQLAAVDYSNDRTAQLNYGYILLRLSKPEKAMDIFQRLIVSQTDDRDAWLSLGLAKVQNREFSEAVRCFEEAKRLGIPGGVIDENLRLALEMDR